MVSFRRSSDQTHITQLLGRMVRTPLARRIPGNDRLNSVDCLLPFFDETAVRAVVAALMQGNVDSPPLGRVLINPKEMVPNPAVSEIVWNKFLSLPSQTRPQRGAKPSIRLTALAQELVLDALLPDAGTAAHAAMHSVLDNFIASRQSEFAEKRNTVLTVAGKTITGDMRNLETTTTAFSAIADIAVIDDAYRRASRILSPDIARTYTEKLARQRPEAEDDFEGALIEAREDIAALGLMENLQIIFDAECTNLSDSWLHQHRDMIKTLPDDRQEAYRQVTALSRAPQDIELARPVSRMEPTSVRKADGTEFTFPTYENHLLCDENGLYPVDLNDWEAAVLNVEFQRPAFRFWYRNPDRPSQDSLGIAYTDGGETKIMRPDFLFFAEQPDGRIVTDIVDPHGVQFADALPKLQGLSRYAETHSKQFRRVEAVAEVGGKLRVLDLTRAEVRSAIADATDAASVYAGPSARDYK